MFKTKSALIIFGRLLTSYGYYMVIPFLAITVTQHKGCSATQAGILMALLNIGRRGFGLFAGYWTDRFRFRTILLVGLFMEMFAYLGYIVAQDFFSICLITLAVGIGGCLYNVSSRAVLAYEKKQGVVTQFSLFYITMHIGALIGPITSAFLIARGKTNYLFGLTAFLYFLFAALTFFLFNEKNASTDENPIQTKMLLQIFKDRQFMHYCFFITLAWFVLNQLYITFPLYLKDSFFSEKTIGNLFALNALLIIIFQYPFAQFLEKQTKQTHISILAMGIFIMSLGWLLFVIPISSLSVIIAMTVFTIGEIFFVGLIDVLASDFAPANQKGLYMGCAMLTWAVGGSLGSVMGAAGLQISQIYFTGSLFWIFICGIGMATAYGLLQAKNSFVSIVSMEAL